MEPLLDVQNLEVRFNTLEGTVNAVNGVSFHLDAGETLGIVGESGCGKSVTVLSVMRLIAEPPGKISNGIVNYGGVNLLEINKTRMQNIRGGEIAMVFQDPMTSLNPVLTIGRQISETLMLHLGLGKDEANARSVELLTMVGIADAADHLKDYPHQFSGGMRQRVMTAMALSCNPKILIADEPTTALDVTIQAQIVELTKNLQDELGMAVIWITHDLGVVAEIADRIIVMYAGYVVESSDVYQIFEEPQHPYTLSLLKSLPRVDNTSHERLATIPGSPPDCVFLPPGCPFQPRCTFALECCAEENPMLSSVGPAHEAACWVDIKTGELR